MGPATSVWNDTLLGPAATLPTEESPDVGNDTNPMAVTTVNVISNTISEGTPVSEGLVPVAGVLTLSQLPLSGSLAIFKNGVRQTDGVDYNALNDVVTLVFPVEDGDTFVATYLAQP